MLPAALRKRLRKIAAERGVSLGAVMRGALEKEAKEYRPKPKAIGIFDSGHADTGAKAGDVEYEPRSWRSS